MRRALTSLAILAASLSAPAAAAGTHPVYWRYLAWLHAARYGNPAYYTQPAVFDVWTEIFLGRPTMATSSAYNDNTVEQTLQCPTGYCQGLTGSICIGPFANNCGGDGRCRPLSVGDTFYIGSIGVDHAVAGTTPSPASRTHTIVVDNGACRGGKSYTVYPWIDYAAEPSVPGTAVAPVWRHEFHPTDGAAYLIGFRLGAASRDVYGAQGQNLVGNPGFDSDAPGVVDGWSLSGGMLDRAAWDAGSGSTPPRPGESCNSGEGTGPFNCVVLDGSTTDLVQASPFTVRSTARLIISGLFQQQFDCDSLGLLDDRDGDGVWTQGPEMKVSFTAADAKTNRYVLPRWFSATVTVPYGVREVKFGYHGCGSTSDWFDYVSVRRQTGLKDSAVSTNWLINAPGTRNIALVGDSWMGPWSGGTPYAEYLRQGLVDALNAHVGTCSGGTNDGEQCTYPGATECTGGGTCGATSPITVGQVTIEGHPGDTTASILASLPGILAADHPLYVIFDGGINDLDAGIPVETALANLKEIARECVAAGAIPIYLGMPPVAKLDGAPVFGPSSVYSGAHEIREGFRTWALGR